MKAPNHTIEILARHARPLNRAWRKIEEKQGFDGDRTAYDYGEPNTSRYESTEA